MDTLIEIRRLMKEGKEAEVQRPAASSVAEDEQTGEGADLYARSRADPKAHCKQYMQMGHRTISTLWSISREAPSVIISKLNVLQQESTVALLLDVVSAVSTDSRGQRLQFALIKNFQSRRMLTTSDLC
eukprot:s103_g2.t1